MNTLAGTMVRNSRGLSINSAELNRSVFLTPLIPGIGPRAVWPTKTTVAKPLDFTY
jgi:hypothetical protein